MSNIELSTNANNYAAVLSKLEEVRIICKNILTLSPYRKEKLFLQVLRIYLNTFDKDKFKNIILEIDISLEKSDEGCFITGKLISPIQQNLSKIQDFDFSEIHQYMFIFKSYNVLLQGILDDALEYLFSEEECNQITNLKNTLKNIFDNSKQYLSQKEKYSDNFDNYLENRLQFLSIELDMIENFFNKRNLQLERRNYRKLKI